MDSPTPSMPNLNPQMPQQQPQIAGSHTGLIVVVIALAVLAIAGGVYYWMFWQTSDVYVPPAQVQNQQAPAADSTSAIEADFNGTEDINLDAEFKDIDADLQTL
ncbi:MAG: hypothetical protein AAB367_00790 [Patescibacteria group bacterium]